jgi:hypothetical protein
MRRPEKEIWDPTNILIIQNWYVNSAGSLFLCLPLMKPHEHSETDKEWDRQKFKRSAHITA